MSTRGRPATVLDYQGPNINQQQVRQDLEESGDREVGIRLEGADEDDLDEVMDILDQEVDGGVYLYETSESGKYAVVAPGIEVGENLDDLQGSGIPYELMERTVQTDPDGWKMVRRTDVDHEPYQT